MSRNNKRIANHVHGNQFKIKIKKNKNTPTSHLGKTMIGLTLGILAVRYLKDQKKPDQQTLNQGLKAITRGIMLI